MNHCVDTRIICQRLVNNRFDTTYAAQMLLLRVVRLGEVCERLPACTGKE